MKELDAFRKFLTKNDKDKTQLNESAPGYDKRGFGEPLPTLESIKAAYEAKRSIKEVGNFDFRIFTSEYDLTEYPGEDPGIYYDAYLDAGPKDEMIALAKRYSAQSPGQKFIVSHSDDWFDEVWSSDSVNEAHKHTYKQIDPDGTAECTKCGLRNTDPSKTGEKVRAGVRSAAEKLGMNPSHIREDIQDGWSQYLIKIDPEEIEENGWRAADIESALAGYYNLESTTFQKDNNTGLPGQIEVTKI